MSLDARTFYNTMLKIWRVDTSHADNDGSGEPSVPREAAVQALSRPQTSKAAVNCVSLVNVSSAVPDFSARLLLQGGCGDNGAARGYLGWAHQRQQRRPAPCLCGSVRGVPHLVCKAHASLGGAFLSQRKCQCVLPTAAASGQDE